MQKKSWECSSINTEEVVGMRKILGHDIRMQKNPQTKFVDLSGVMRVQSPTCTPAQKFNQWRH